MGAITIRQQFLIPTTPYVLLDGFIGLSNLGTQYSSSTSTSGDSYIHVFTTVGGHGVINFRFEIHLEQLLADGDYYVIDADLTAISQELVITVTIFLNLVPYPSWRFRLNRLTDPYSQFKIAPLSTESDITKVTFSQEPYWISTIFGVEGRGREYFFVKCSGLSFPRVFPFLEATMLKNPLPVFPSLK